MYVGREHTAGVQHVGAGNMALQDISIGSWKALEGSGSIQGGDHGMAAWKDVRSQHHRTTKKALLGESNWTV